MNARLQQRLFSSHYYNVATNFQRNTTYKQCRIFQQYQALPVSHQELHGPRCPRRPAAWAMLVSLQGAAIPVASPLHASKAHLSSALQ